MIRRRKPIHFVFSAHGASEIYRKKPLSKNVKTFVTEGGEGWPADKLFTREVVAKLPESKKREYTKKQFFLSLLESGKKLVIGETVIPNSIEKEKLHLLHYKMFRFLETAASKPSLINVKKYLVAVARYNKFRHKLIRRTIKKLIKQKEIPLEAQYGTYHSLLSNELKKRGIESSREIMPQVFDWETILLRKLMLGIKPQSISPVEYKKGVISFRANINKNMTKIITGKYHSKITDRDFRFLSLVETTLLNRLEEKQIDEIIKKRDVSLMFEFNGLPNPFKENTPYKEFRKKLVEFLNKYSEFQKTHKQF